MTRYLFDVPPRFFMGELAQNIGLNEAIILQEIQFWIAAGKGKEVDGRRWIYNSLSSWQEEMPWWSEDTIRRALDSLERKGLIATGNFNQVKMDRTRWYTIDYDRLNELEESAATRHYRKMPGWMAQNAPTIPLATSTSYASDQEAGLSKKKDQRERKQKKEPIELSPPDQPVEQETASDDDAAPRRPTKAEKEQLALALSRLAEAFSQRSGIPLPTPSGKRDWSEYNVRWMRPLKAILEMTQTVGNATVLIHKAVDHMRADDLTLASPQSIEKVAVSIFAKEQGDKDDVYW